MPTYACICILTEFRNILLFLLQFGSFKKNLQFEIYEYYYKYTELAYNTNSTSIWHQTSNFICASVRQYSYYSVPLSHANLWCLMEKNYLLVSPDDDTNVRPNKVKYNRHCTTRFLKAPAQQQQMS